MEQISITFPDAATKKQFERWWALSGKQSCEKYIERTIEPNPEREPFLYSDAQGDPDAWVVWWDAIPF